VNSANNGLKELLKTAEVTIEKRDRVVLKATLSPSLLTELAQDDNSLPPPATEPDAGASK
jgi:hypothetical protein